MKLFLVIAIFTVVFWGQTVARPSSFDKVEHRAIEDGVAIEDIGDVTTLSYYGGAKGSILKIGKKSDGSIVTDTVNTAKSNDSPTADFSNHLTAIQKAAAILVALQERVRMTGKLSGSDKKIYADHLELLGISAQKLAQLQNDAADNDLNLLFQGIAKEQEDGDNKRNNGSEGDFDNVGEEPEKNPEEEPQKPPAIEVPDKGEEGIAVNAPPKEAPIAEAKPVGLAIAGPGGLAASKPVATAVVSKDGLAVARPVATAISGISPEQFAMLSLPIPQKINFGGLPVRPREGSTEGNSWTSRYGLLSLENGLNVLVGPGFQLESRFSDKGIDADAEDGEKKMVVDLDSSNDAKTIAMEKFKKLAEAPREAIPNQYPLIPPYVSPLSYRVEGPNYQESFEPFPPAQYLPPSDQYASGSLPYPFLPLYNPYQRGY
ncbi:uncharacterized protein LOC129792416 isoform X2 [Lutzomyia longipalpis]|uniref:uncharacterized protein LOC129792416 isoform X2 n=1 Tax=Lutzomyia longipalpis TaxID=7200 RepID=UPI002483E63C|nr:uncharacterized protein LOC129792416 isoform X2 [Lutzomyia longipalpis]